MPVDNNCPYCGNCARSLLRFNTTEDGEIVVDITGNLLRMYCVSDDSYSIETEPINYCPKCGRNLCEDRV